MLGSRPVFISTFPCLGLDLGLELCIKANSMSTFIFVPCLDLDTSGLEPNTGTYIIPVLFYILFFIPICIIEFNLYQHNEINNYIPTKYANNTR